MIDQEKEPINSSVEPVMFRAAAAAPPTPPPPPPPPPPPAPVGAST